MQRVILVPMSDAARFPGLEVIARKQDIAALAGPSVPGRSRDAYSSDDEFLAAVARGFADRFTFPTIEEAVAFTEDKLDDLARRAQEIEDEVAARRKVPPDVERLEHNRSNRWRA